MLGQKIYLRLRSLFQLRAVDQELDEEVRFHVEQQTEELVRSGVPRREAELMAQRQFGNVTLHKEQCRDARNLAWLEGIAQDLRQGLRTLRRTPGFTVVSVLTLALGIGATSAMFSVIDRAVLNPVIAPDPGRLVWLQESSKAHSESGSNPMRLADWQKARSFSAVAGIYSEALVWTSPAGPVRLSVLRAYGDLLGVLQPSLQLGRAFTAAESTGEGPAVALLTARAFRQRFQGNAGVLNQTIRLADTPYQVIGVLNPGVDFPDDVEVWTPARLAVPSRAAGFLDLVARLAPGASLRGAQAEIDVFSRRLAQQYPASDAGRSARAILLETYVASAARKPLLMLFGAVLSVLFIGCLNIAGLLLARGLGRRREAAIRVSVGAGYARLARLFFAESLLLALMGCAGGLLLAFAGVEVLRVTLPAYVPNLSTITVTLPVVLFGIGFSLLAALLFGGLPAWQFASDAQAFALKEGGAATGAVSKNRLRGVLVVAEVAVSVVLLTTSALLANSFLNVLNRSLGFNTANTYTFAVQLPWDANPGLIASLSAETLTRLNSLPGTVAGGVVDRLPLHGGTQSGLFVVRGKTFDDSIAEKEFGFRTASAGYFAAVGIPLLEGTIYTDGPRLHEAVISRRLAQILFPGDDAIGHEIAERPGAKAKEPEWFRIVGVVGSVSSSLANMDPAAEMYVPWGATYWPLMNFVVRTKRPMGDVARFVREQIQPLNAEEIFSPVTTLDERIAEVRSAPRVSALLVGGFAVVALALSALGIFGLMAHETNRKTQEIGIRLALGAEPQSIAVSAVLQAVRLVVSGLAIGLCGAWYASGVVKSLLYEVGPHNASSYAVAAGILMVTAVLAALWPAVRAARIDPIRALRHE